MTKKWLKITPILAIPATLTTIGCNNIKQPFDNTFAYELAIEMTMINHLDYDKIINQDLAGNVERINLKNIVFEMANEPNIFDYYSQNILRMKIQ